MAELKHQADSAENLRLHSTINVST